MKRLLIVAIALTMVACGGSETEEESTDTNIESTESTEESDESTEEALVHENTPDIAPGSAGMFEIGAKVPGLPEDLSSRVGTAPAGDEGGEIRTVVVYNHFEDMIDLHMEDNPDAHVEDLHIVEMMIHSDYYKTDDGIGVGTTIEHFAEVYPDYNLWYTYISDRYILETEVLIGIQFLLDFHDCKITPKGDSDMETLELSDFKEGAKIQAIRVY